MSDDKKPERQESGASSSKPGANLPATRAEARARLRAATGAVGPDMAVAAARAVAQLRLGFANSGAQIGFLDDVVDFTEDVVDVTEEVINHLAANTEEITHLLEEATPEITPVTIITIGLAAEGGGGGPLEGVDDPHGASAQRLLEARKAILEATAIQSKGLKAIAQSLRAQIAAMQRPKP